MKDNTSMFFFSGLVKAANSISEPTFLSYNDDVTYFFKSVLIILLGSTYYQKSVHFNSFQWIKWKDADKIDFTTFLKFYFSFFFGMIQLNLPSFILPMQNLFKLVQGNNFFYFFIFLTNPTHNIYTTKSSLVA